MEVEVGEDEGYGGDDYDGDVALGLEEVREDGDEEQYAEQDGYDALLIGQRKAEQAGEHLEGAAAVGDEHGHERVLAGHVAEDDLALAEQEAREQEVPEAEDNLQKAGYAQHFRSASHAAVPPQALTSASSSTLVQCGQRVAAMGISLWQ